MYPLTDVAIPYGVTSIGAQAFFACSSLSSVTIPDSVTVIGLWAFGSCSSLTSVTIGRAVANINEFAFDSCVSLTGVFFRGNAPSLTCCAFYWDTSATVFYLPGTRAWGATFFGVPTAPWVRPAPLILSTPPSFGVRTNQFGFVISWATNASVVVEACTDLALPDWSPVGTNTLVQGWSFFSHPEWTNRRFYPLRSP